MLEGLRSTLVIRLSSLGDVVLTAPVFTNLRAGLPDARLSLLVKRAFAAVFDGHPAVDEVLIFEDRGFWGWLREVRRRRFDTLVDLHDTPRSRLWSLFSGAARRLRYDKRSGARRRLVWFKRSSPTLSGRTVDRYLETLAGLGLPVKSRTPELFLKTNESLSPEWMSRLGDGPFIAVAPGALHETKRWPGERFAQAADRLADIAGQRSNRAAQILLLGAAGDRPAAEETRRALRGHAQDLAGQTTLREMMLILEKCAVLLTNDSGASHLGAALGVPTVVLFGPTVKAFGFFPLGGKVAVMENPDLPCRPCTLHGGRKCPLGHFKCMTDIPVESVVNAALTLL